MKVFFPFSDSQARIVIMNHKRRPHSRATNPYSLDNKLMACPDLSLKNLQNWLYKELKKNQYTNCNYEFVCHETIVSKYLLFCCCHF